MIFLLIKILAYIENIYVIHTATTAPKKYITSIPKAVKKGDDNIESLPLISGLQISAVYITAGVVDIPILNPMMIRAIINCKKCKSSIAKPMIKNEISAIMSLKIRVLLRPNLSQKYPIR